MERTKSFVACSVSDCDGAAHIKGLCIKHYARMKRHGSTDDPREKGWGQKRNHPFYRRWQKLYMRNMLSEDWKDFWKFVSDVGQPVNAIKLDRPDKTKLFGPTNFEWLKTPTEEDRIEYQKQYRTENARQLKNARFLREYGITLDEYERLFEQQKGLCAICEEPEKVKHRNHSDRVRMLCIDHCHPTGKVRGLLCGDCNRGLGMFRDNPKYLKDAAEYVLKFIP